MNIIKRNIPEIICLFVFVLFVFVLTSCDWGNKPQAPIIIQSTPNQPIPPAPPQQQCEIITITGIGRCVYHQQCPPPSYLCETVINNQHMVYSCNPSVGQQQRICR